MLCFHAGLTRLGNRFRASQRPHAASFVLNPEEFSKHRLQSLGMGSGQPVARQLNFDWMLRMLNSKVSDKAAFAVPRLAISRNPNSGWWLPAFIKPCRMKMACPNYPSPSRMAAMKRKCYQLHNMRAWKDNLALDPRFASTHCSTYC